MDVLEVMGKVESEQNEEIERIRRVARKQFELRLVKHIDLNQ